MARRYTIEDIARLAGVSKTTVSRVLRHQPDVHPATRRSILRIMAERGFMNHAPIHDLAGNLSRLIGVVVPSLAWAMTHEMVRGVAEVLEPRAYELIVCSRLPQKDGATALDALLDACFIAGLVVILPETSSVRLAQLSEQGFPMVLIEYPRLLSDPSKLNAEPRVLISQAALTFPTTSPGNAQMVWDRPEANEHAGSRMFVAVPTAAEGQILSTGMRHPVTEAERPFQEIGRRAAQLLLWQAEMSSLPRKTAVVASSPL